MSDWRDKEAINETVFREMNEWTEEGTDAVLGRATGSMPTCASAPTVVALSPSGSRAWYEAIRVEPLRFAVALNHENPEIDRIVKENERFATVDKFHGGPRRIARETDPRR